MKEKLPYYIESMRLRTLPLAVAGILMGSLLAASFRSWDGTVFIFALLTALSLQILSNIANELGDLEKGTDNEHRLGPIRSVQRGMLSKKELFNFLILFLVLSAFNGALLVWFSFGALFSTPAIIMLILGALAMFASIKYTFGKNAYGYIGLGDLFVFLFFGLVSVAGVFFLMYQSLPLKIFLPASSVGLLSTAMLNQNNMRDMDNDENFGKKTMAVRMGLKGAKIYHTTLISLAFALMIWFTVSYYNSVFNFLFLLSLPLFVMHLVFVFRNNGRALDSHMKMISLSTILFAVLGGLGFLF